MALFVEVHSEEKNCPVIINLDHIIEIAPLVTGGCALFMNDSAGVNSKTGMRVTNSYEQFKQFAMQTVTSDMLEDRIAQINQAAGVSQEERRGRGRPPKAATAPTVE